MFGAYGFGQFPFGGLLRPSRRRRGHGGIGGSGMSDAEYRRLLRRLGTLVSDDLTDDEVASAATVLRELGYL
jgi:hypothetical protein